jgi:hypothetical protein
MDALTCTLLDIIQITTLDQQTIEEIHAVSSKKTGDHNE